MWKYIIEDNKLKMANVICHFEISKDGINANEENIKGGRRVFIDKLKNIIYLYEKSVDFGQPTLDDFKSADIDSRWDDYIIKFTQECNFDIVRVMSDNAFDFIRDKIKE